MLKTYRVMLHPNNKQATRMFRTAGCARFAYNWAIATERDNHANGGKFLSNCDLRKRFTLLKRDPEFAWLNDVSNNATKQAIKDACLAFKNFFEHRAQFPKFKKKHRSHPSFYADTCKIEFTETHIKLEKIADSKRANRAKANWIRLAERARIPTNIKYANPRVTFDGLNWWISVAVDEAQTLSPAQSEAVGIDMGVKHLAVCSDGRTYENINKTGTVRRTEKRKRRLQRQVSRKYQINEKGKYLKTCNIKKLEKRLLKVSRRLTHIRTNHIHQATSGITKRNPSLVVMEDLNVSGMLKNRRLSKAVQEQALREFRRQMQYKCEWRGIRFITAGKFFPSSKLCSKCGAVKSNLKLGDRVYKCECGLELDRDYNAALNLKAYGAHASA